MADDGLVELRKKLTKKIGGVWDKDEVRDFRDTLEDTVEGTDVPEDYEDIVFETGDISEKMKESAEKADLDDKYESDWDKAPDELMKELYKVDNYWSPETRQVITDIIYGADISDLYELAAAGKYEKLVNKLGGDVSVADIDNYADALNLIADVKDLKKNLKEAWGIGG